MITGLTDGDTSRKNGRSCRNFCRSCHNTEEKKKSGLWGWYAIIALLVPVWNGIFLWRLVPTGRICVECGEWTDPNFVGEHIAVFYAHRDAHGNQRRRKRDNRTQSIISSNILALHVSGKMRRTASVSRNLNCEVCAHIGKLENSLIDHLLIPHYLGCHAVSYSLSDSITLWIIIAENDIYWNGISSGWSINGSIETEL